MPSPAFIKKSFINITELYQMKQNLCKADNDNILRDTQTAGVYSINTTKYCHSACFKK